MKRTIVAAAVSGVLMTLSHGAGASGFAIIEQSVSGLGNAFAGGAASAHDASTVFFNPAGMTYLQQADERNRVIVGSHIVVPSAKYRDGGSRSVLGLPMGTATTGDAGSAAAVPNFYYVNEINDTFMFGFGVNAPYALATEYDTNWVGRYHALESEVMAINVNPNLAWRLGEHVSVGIGADFQYIEAKLSNAIDYGTIDAVAMGGAVGLTPGASDGYGEITGDDTGWGWNFGMIIGLNDDNTSRFGFHYRSGIEYELRGDADFNVPLAATPIALGLGHVDTGASAALTTPATLSMSLFHQIDDRWSIMADATHTDWETLEEIRIRFDNGAADSVTTTLWEDSWRYSVGLTFRQNDRWTWRTGIAFDETPIPSAELRTPRIPGEDRTWLAFGFNYKIDDAISVDLGYTHLWVDDPEINKRTALPTVDENTFRGSLVGEYDADVDIISAQLNWKF